MNMILKAFLALLLAACSSSTQDEPEPVELASNEQALVTGLPDGFGWTPESNDGGRCFTDNGAFNWTSDCYVPGRRRVNILVKKSTCTGVYAARYAEAFESAYSYVADILTGRGWEVIRDRTDALALHGYNLISLECGSIFPGASPASGGGTRIDAATNCIDTQYGDLCKYFNSVSRLYQSRIQGPTFTASSTTDLRRRNYLHTLAVHELGHSIGLGHDECGPTPLAQAMNHVGCMSGSDTSTWNKKAYTQVELDWLRDYRVP